MRGSKLCKHIYPAARLREHGASLRNRRGNRRTSRPVGHSNCRDYGPQPGRILSALKFPNDLFLQLLEYLPGLSVAGMLLEQFKQDIARLVRRSFDHVDSRKIQVGLIEGRRHADALFKAGDGLIATI